MVRTLASIFVSLALILGISAYDIYTVGKTFHTFSEALVAAPIPLVLKTSSKKGPPRQNAPKVGITFGGTVLLL